jgi:glycerophosphoryl diester phosphodiesterase
MVAGGRPQRPAVLAHRGGASLGVENDLATMALAQEAGADAVEIDPVQTSCGSLALVHDAFLVDGDRWLWVRDLTLDEVTDLSGTRPATHDELLRTCRELGLGCYAEVKAAAPEVLDRFVADVVEHGLEELVCVGSFRADLVARVGRGSPLDASWLTHDLFADPVATAADLGCRFVHPCADDNPGAVDLLAGEWIERVWNAGLGVVSWNTLDPELARRFAEVGVAAVCTDDPRIVPPG